MKEYIAFIIATLLTYGAMAQMPWQASSPLTWDDFNGVPDTSLSYSAYTAYNINYTWKWTGDGTLSFNVECTFNKAGSWKRPERDLTPALLRHEQLHFNVAEIYAGKIGQAFIDYAFSHKHSDATATDIKQIFNRLLAECIAYNAQYDKETDHSDITTKQKEWDDKITALITIHTSK